MALELEPTCRWNKICLFFSTNVQSPAHYKFSFADKYSLLDEDKIVHVCACSIYSTTDRISEQVYVSAISFLYATLSLHSQLHL